MTDDQLKFIFLDQLATLSMDFFLSMDTFVLRVKKNGPREKLSEGLFSGESYFVDMLISPEQAKALHALFTDKH